MINTSIVASIPFALALLTADVPYDNLVNIVGNVNIIATGQLGAADIDIFVRGLQHALLIFSGLILASAIFSFLRGSRSKSVPTQLHSGAPAGD